MLKHLICFIISVLISVVLIASVDWIHSYFVNLLTKPIEKNIAENVARDYSQLMMHMTRDQVIPTPIPVETTVESLPPSITISTTTTNNDISDYVANMNHTYTPDQYIEMKSELKSFMQSAYDDDTTEIADIPNL